MYLYRFASPRAAPSEGPLALIEFDLVEYFVQV